MAGEPLQEHPPVHLAEQAQKHRGGLPHALDLLKLVGPGREHLIEGAEPVQQPMGQGVHVHPRQGVGQQQLQHLVVRHALDALLPIALPEPGPVSRVLVHVNLSKSFRSLCTYATGNPSSLRVGSQVMPSSSPTRGHRA